MILNQLKQRSQQSWQETLLKFCLRRPNKELSSELEKSKPDLVKTLTELKLKMQLPKLSMKFFVKLTHSKLIWDHNLTMLSLKEQANHHSKVSWQRPTHVLMKSWLESAKNSMTHMVKLNLRLPQSRPLWCSPDCWKILKDNSQMHQLKMRLMKWKCHLTRVLETTWVSDKPFLTTLP